jgi:NitT/TauT family transport system permease protein
MTRYLPIFVVALFLIALAYPVALLLGLPLARKDVSDIRKWQKETITAQAPLDISNPKLLPFEKIVVGSLLIQNDQPLNLDYTIADHTVALSEPLEHFVTLGKTLENASGRYYHAYSSGESIPLDSKWVLYADDRLLQEGSSIAKELPDGTRHTFTVSGDPVMVDNQVLVSEDGLMDPSDALTYKRNGQQITLGIAPAFGSTIRGLTGDYAVLEVNTGTIVTAQLFEDIRIAIHLPRLAETLQGDIDGTNRSFRFAQPNLVEADKDRKVFLDHRLLSDAAERPKERVDGIQSTFTFNSDKGLVVLNGVLLKEDADYKRAGNTVTFNQTPIRNAELRQYPDYYLSNPAVGEILLTTAPPANSKLWTSQYTVYTQPACGSSLWQCFYALPQHPMPFPHWVVRRIPAYFSKYSLTDERNVIQAVLYTILGTLSSLVLGGIIGSLLAVLFVLFRPLERALLPWTIASQTIPIIALVPVMLLILGNFGITIQTSLLPTAIIGAYICFFPVVVSTVKGLRSVDPLTLDLMKSYASTPLQVFRKVRFPAAVPFVFTGLKLGTAAALVGALVAETESNNKRGLGFQILGQVQTGNVADVWILLLISAFLGVGLVSLVGFLQRVIAPWERK